jgi:hypothetical protein
VKRRRGGVFYAVFVMTLGTVASEACSQAAAPAGAGGTCSVVTDCAEGYVCIKQPDGSHQCSNDLSGIQSTEDSGVDSTTAAPSEAAPPDDATAPPDDGGTVFVDGASPVGEGATPSADTGAPPKDTGAPPQDTGTPVSDSGMDRPDTGAAAPDTGAAERDTGAAVDDTGTTVQDAGTPAQDTGASQDTGTE